MDPRYSLIANGVGSPQLCYVLGDLYHKIDVYTCILTPDQSVANCYISIEARAEFLCEKYTDLVPDRDPQGNLPSNKKLSQIFCGHYYCDTSFKSDYVHWLYQQSQQRHG